MSRGRRGVTPASFARAGGKPSLHKRVKHVATDAKLQGKCGTGNISRIGTLRDSAVLIEMELLGGFVWMVMATRDDSPLAGKMGACDLCVCEMVLRLCRTAYTEH
jgi:hypothetical protein